MGCARKSYAPREAVIIILPPSSFRELGDNIVDHVAVHIGQSHVPPTETERQLLVIDAEQVKHRGM